MSRNALLGRRREAAIAAYAAGMTMAEIARAFEVHVDAVRPVVAPDASPRREVTTREVAAWRAQRGAGMTWADIAAAAGRTLTTVRRHAGETSR